MKSHHFLIISFPIQGHINPILQLAKNLARLGAKVTFATTDRILHRLQDSLPTLHRLSYASFSDSHHHEEQEKTTKSTTDYMAELRQVGSKNLTRILQESLDGPEPVTCLVYSLLLPWAAAVARGMQIPSAFLSIQCATAFAIYHRFSKPHNEIIDPVDVLQDLPLFSSSDLPTFLLPDNPMYSFMKPMMIEHMQELETDTKPLVLLNTFEELEQDAIESLKAKNMNVITIGPLIPSAFSDGNNSTDKSFGGDLFVTKKEDYFKWLDTKPENSVIYVAFGSLVVMNKDQKIEFLHGLVESKRPFLWVIRSSSSDSVDETETKKMIDDSNIIGENGMIVEWCAQMEVLSHKSIGCFVTHCGWNSTLEGLICGVPFICCPHFSDQLTNAKLVEEVWGTGVRARANGEVLIEREELKKCLDVVMGECERGREMRRNALKWRGLALEAVKENGSTYNNLIRVLK
ncbi:hypothetical protein ABFS82_07G073400 [Erythranthe guttata]|uniref:anthocyanidin 3-O-glucoside 5-O-glucosyltransferase n=1 Tax=Erythranthe guttata TaxID=4155 RepID=A0A022QEC9_ERYGU|nr:PREDICTED: crocetin glucosyltransferase, chloroplastic-like [Erythranthe guttata]EYU27002.1 hypothetical protein MIMGU_mgv1a023035mg [Erythranthe guttata]|eukprot:XP_012849809.1 PREDICTED: crocetin glucosyltransferase, chloroplastic-like [Erythranthe guttata]